MKKALIFSFGYYPHIGGAEVAVKEITDRIRDIEFDLLTFNFGGRQKKYEKIDNVNVYRISSFSKYFFPVKSFLKATFFHAKNPYSFSWSMMANVGFAPLFLEIFFKVPFVLTIQEGDPIGQIKKRVWFVYPIFKMIFKKARVVTAISSYLADFAKTMGAKNILIVPNGVDISIFKRHVRSEKSLADNIVMTTISRLVYKNGIDNLIKSLNYLPNNFSLWIFGEGPDRAFLEKLSSSFNLQYRIKFWGHVEHSKLSNYLEQADIFARPSRTEGLGNVFFEAMASGLPVIATPVGGIKDFLIDGQTGLFCEVENPEDIADKVRRIINDKELRQKMTENGRKLVVEKYNWDIIAKKFRNDIFDELVKK